MRSMAPVDSSEIRWLEHVVPASAGLLICPALDIRKGFSIVVWLQFDRPPTACTFPFRIGIYWAVLARDAVCRSKRVGKEMGVSRLTEFFIEIARKGRLFRRTRCCAVGPTGRSID